MNAEAAEVVARPKRSKHIGKKSAKKASLKSGMGARDIETAVEKECYIFKRKLNAYVKQQLCAFRGRAHKACTSNNTIRKGRVGKKEESVVLPAETQQ